MRKALRALRELVRRFHLGEDGKGLTLKANGRLQDYITFIVRSRHNVSGKGPSFPNTATLKPISIESTTIRKCLVTSYRGQPA
jgi:hypothetical protein